MRRRPATPNRRPWADRRIRQGWRRLAGGRAGAYDGRRAIRPVRAQRQRRGHASRRGAREEYDVPTSEERLERLQQMRREALLGGAVRIERQHTFGKRPPASAWPTSWIWVVFVELDAFVTDRATEFGLDNEHILGDGVVTGHGLIDGWLRVRFKPTLHGLRLALGGLRREDREGHGPRDEGRGAGRRAQRSRAGRASRRAWPRSPATPDLHQDAVRVRSDPPGPPWPNCAAAAHADLSTAPRNGCRITM